MSRYRIRNVSQLSGVSAATLRAWERRYGVPSPARTASSYRLYDDADVATIKRMRDLVQGGIAAAEAARIVLSSAPSREEAPREDADPFALASERIVAAAVRLDPDALEREVSRSLTLGPAVTLFDRVLGPALRRIGDLWHEGAITVAQEHLASQVAAGALLDLIRLSQPAEATRRVALACFADEDHVLGLYGMALRFTSWGYRTVMIGARTPPTAIARITSTIAPDLVGLSVTIPPPSARARELVDAYADACHTTPWIVGGQAAEGMRSFIERRGGMVASPSAIETRRTLERAFVQRRRRGSAEPAE
ncbi:MAG: MerR family transcriptional regulator [Byssovorax sp.]